MVVWRARRIFAGIVAVLALACLPVSGPIGGRIAVAGDAGLAKFLLKGGKDDLGKKQYDAAFSKFARAEQEDPSLLEAVFWQGLALDRKPDVKAAVAAYRRFAAAVDAKVRSASATRDESALLRTAQDRIAVLATGEVERRKLDDAFVEALLNFAKSNAAKDPVTTIKALRLLTSARPDHAAARQMLEKLGVAVEPPAGGAPASAPPPRGEFGSAIAPVPKPAAPIGPFLLVKNWTDHVTAQTFGNNGGWRYDVDRITIDDRSTGMIRAPSEVKLGTRYAVEFDCRMLEAYGPKPLVGFVFGFQPKPVRHLYTWFETTGAAILHRGAGEEVADIARVEFETNDAAAWHRLGVVVRGRTIEYWLDGRKRGEHEIREGEDASGELGVFHQSCRAEIRLYRSGALP